MPTLVDDNALIGDGASLSVSVAPSGTNRIVLAWVYVYDGGTPALPAAMTCGGNAMTLVHSRLDFPENVRFGLYRYINPAMGSQNVVVTPAATAIVMACMVEAWSDVDQTTPLGTAVGAAVNDGLPLSVNASSAAGQVVADGGFGYIGSATFAPGAGQTQDVAYDPEPGGNVLFGSHEAGAATTTMSWGALDGTMTTIAVPLIAAGVTATKLAITAQPGNTVVGATIATVQVEAQDASNALDTSYTSNVTIALQIGSGTLSGTLTRAAVAGVATFNNLSINTLNTGAVLRVTSGALTQADSNTFNVTAGGGTGGSLIGSALVS